MSLWGAILGAIPLLHKADPEEGLDDMKKNLGKQKFRPRCSLVTNRSLDKKLDQIIMNQAELAAGLTKIQTQVGKVAKEQSDRFDALSKEIADLKAVIDAGGNVTPEVAQAVTDVQTALQSLDDTIPDAPPTP